MAGWGGRIGVGLLHIVGESRDRSWTPLFMFTVNFSRCSFEMQSVSFYDCQRGRNRVKGGSQELKVVRVATWVVTRLSSKTGSIK